MKQFYRRNATLFEWGNSPIVYKTTKLWKEIYEKSKKYFSVKAASYHYYSIANNTYHQYLQEEFVRYKKYFYALRPLLAGKYIQKYNCSPPVLFEELMQLDMPTELCNEIDKLLEIKKKSDEKEKGLKIPIIQEFITKELELQSTYAKGIVEDKRKDWECLNDIFLKVLEGI